MAAKTSSGPPDLQTSAGQQSGLPLLADPRGHTAPALRMTGRKFFGSGPVRSSPGPGAWPRPAQPRTLSLGRTGGPAPGVAEKAERPPATGRNPVRQAGSFGNKGAVPSGPWRDAVALPRRSFGGRALWARPANVTWSSPTWHARSSGSSPGFLFDRSMGCGLWGRVFRLHRFGPRCRSCPISAKEAPLPGGQEGVLLRSGVWCVEAR